MSNIVYPYAEHEFVLARDYKKLGKKGWEVVKKKGEVVSVGFLLEQESKTVPVLNEKGEQQMDENKKPMTKLDTPFWTMSRESRRDKQINTVNIMYHWFVQLIGDLAGVKFNTPELIVKPEVQNGLTAVFAIKGEREDGTDVFEVGESNAKSSAINYPVSVALKRAHDRYVLDYLRMYTAYSEIEAEDFKKEGNAPTLDSLSPAEQKLIAPWVQKINNAKDVPAMETLGTDIKEWVKVESAKAKTAKKEMPKAPVLVLGEIFKRKMSEVAGDGIQA